MSEIDIQYFVTHQDETLGKGSAASSHIPTIGSATTSIDTYRTAGIASSNLNSFSIAATDVAAMSALERIAVGPITSVADLQAAETALAAILLYDQLSVVTWGPKVDFGGFVSGTRTDLDVRSSLAFEIANLAQARDWLIVPEFASMSQGRVTKSSLPESLLLDKSAEDIRDLRGNYWSPSIEHAVICTLAELSVPTYLADPRLSKALSADNFQKRLYSRVNISWKKHIDTVPKLNVLFAFPPLLAILFDRMANRQDLLGVIAELRDELRPVRIELYQLNQRLHTIIEQRDVERLCRHIEEAFSAIIPESRMSNAERNRRSMGRVWRVVKPIKNFFLAFQEAQVPPDDLAKLTLELEQALFTQECIVDRTVTSKVFADLFDTWNVYRNINEIFSQSEIAQIGISAR